MSCYKFELPWPPSVNAWKTPFRGRMILTKAGRQYRKAVYAAMYELNLIDEAVAGDLRVRLTLEPPTLRRYDIDNFCKSPFDALTECGFWGDDSQIVELVIKKAPKFKGGRITIEVDRVN